MSTFWERAKKNRKSRSKYSESERKAQNQLRNKHAWASRRKQFGPTGISPAGYKKLKDFRTKIQKDEELLLELDWSEIV